MGALQAIWPAGYLDPNGLIDTFNSGISVDLTLIERDISAPSSETIEHMAKRLRVPVKAFFRFGDRSKVVSRPARRSNNIIMAIPNIIPLSSCKRCIL